VSRRRYLTSRRMDELHGLLTPADWEVLRTLEVVRVATGLQLQRLHHGGIGDAAKQRRLRQLTRLSRWRTVTRLARRVGGHGAGSMSTIYCLDVAGQRLLDTDRDRPRTPWTPSTPFLFHALTVTELYVELVETERKGALQLLDFSAEPACWRNFTDRRGDGVPLKPDALVVIGLGAFQDSWFVEIDRATESRPRITAKARLYVEYHATGLEQVRHDVFPRVVWVVPNATRQEQIINALRRLDAEGWDLFAVVTVDAIIAAMTGEVGVVARPADREVPS
jgi:hypothetical protein